jgi:arylsulfatase A-like enzyme
LLDLLEPSGILDQAYIIVTSDHGESFERGVEGHITPLLFEPVIHIPLLISAPGQRERKDTYTPTACVDLLPTVLHLTGNEMPDWCEGQVLPHLGGAENPSRSIFALEAKTNPAYAPLTRTGVAMLKGPHKLIYHTGYEREDSFELYDLQEDHEELRDLYPESPAFARRLREELLEKLNSENSRI